MLSKVRLKSKNIGVKVTGQDWQVKWEKSTDAFFCKSDSYTHCQLAALPWNFPDSKGWKTKWRLSCKGLCKGCERLWVQISVLCSNRGCPMCFFRSTFTLGRVGELAPTCLHYASYAVYPMLYSEGLTTSTKPTFQMYPHLIPFKLKLCIESDALALKYDLKNHKQVK